MVELQGVRGWTIKHLNIATVRDLFNAAAGIKTSPLEKKQKKNNSVCDGFTVNHLSASGVWR